METVNQSNYLGKEKTSKLLGKFAFPCILSLIISCLYNIVDQIFVGNMVGYLGDTHNYDLLFDSSIGIEKSADTICRFIKNNFNIDK